MIIEGAILQPECIFLQTDYTNSAGRNATDWIAFIPHLHLELDLMCYLPHDDREKGYCDDYAPFEERIKGHK